MNSEYMADIQLLQFAALLGAIALAAADGVQNPAPVLRHGSFTCLDLAAGEDGHWFGVYV